MASTATSQSQPSSYKDVKWFKPDIAEIQPAFRALMEDYSKIPPDEVKSHILNIVSHQAVTPETLAESSCLIARESMANVSLSLHWSIQLPDAVYYLPCLLSSCTLHLEHTWVSSHAAGHRVLLGPGPTQAGQRRRHSRKCVRL